jgi:peptidoglycan glycosyltransferase
MTPTESLRTRKLQRTKSKRRCSNRATQGLYPPGSTFKVVTAAAGLDSGTITPETTIDAPGTLDVEGQPLQNDFTEDFGPIPRHALTNSVNTWFAQLGQTGRRGHAVRIHGTFGFNATPAIDLPEDEVYRAASTTKARLLGRQRPGRPRPRRDRPGAAAGDAAADGEVAAARRQRRQLMKPQIWSRVIDPDGA